MPKDYPLKLYIGEENIDEAGEILFGIIIYHDLTAFFSLLQADLGAEFVAQLLFNSGIFGRLFE